MVKKTILGVKVSNLTERNVNHNEDYPGDPDDPGDRDEYYYSAHAL